MIKLVPLKKIHQMYVFLLTKQNKTSNIYGILKDQHQKL